MYMSEDLKHYMYKEDFIPFNLTSFLNLFLVLTASICFSALEMFYLCKE